MLKIFRKKIVSKIILWGLLILILPAFVMWGSASMSRSKDKGPAYVGIIGERKVSFDDLYNAMTGVRSQIILNYFNQPKALDTLLADKTLLAKLGWDRIIMLGAAKKMKIRASDKEVINYIRSHPLFVRNNSFDDRFYSYILKNNIGMEPRSFEEIIRQNIVLQKLTESFGKDIKLSDADILDEYNKEFGKYRISYILLEPKSIMDKVKLDENAAKDFFEKHKNELKVKPVLQGVLPERQATFEESKETVENYLKEVEARKQLKEEAGNIRKKIVQDIKDRKESFQKAASRMGLETKETEFFSAQDKVEAIGDTPRVAYVASIMEISGVCEPFELNKGFIIFSVLDKKNPGEEEFKKNKEEYSKKVRERKLNEVMEKWLRKLENKTSLAIKFDEIEKYYR